MGFSSNLDLDELLSYLLSGSFFLATLSTGYPLLLREMRALVGTSESSGFDIAVLVVLLSTIALFFGHLFSMVARYFVRIIVNWLFGDPKKAILSSRGGRRACPSFFSDEFLNMFRAKYQKVMGIELEAGGMSYAVPRVVRSYVLHRSESARKVRERLIGFRAFCANLAVAFMFSSVANIFTLPQMVHLFLWAGAVILMIKQRSLDERESKEIYAHFLVL